MSHPFHYLPLALLTTLAACSPTDRNESAAGTILAATQDSVTLATAEGDTLSFRTPADSRTAQLDLLAGDSAEVYYHGAYRAGIAADSIVLRSRPEADNAGLGQVETRTYSGLLPAASGPGIRYDLTVRAPRHSGDGTFELSLTYLEAENGQDRTFRYTGRRWTQRGIPGDNDATVWQLVTEDEQERFNFLVESDSVLTLLNDRFERPSSRLNYSLKRTE